jgi:A/G-specific adenine glycosylase
MAMIVGFYSLDDQKEVRRELSQWNPVLTPPPLTGLLAGLHEFPTSPEVPASISASEESATAMTLLSRLFNSPPLDAYSKVADSAPPDGPRLVKIERAGDVLHVFSHIRKTYRVQWVVLEGGGANPPELATRAASVASGRPKETKLKVKAGSRKLESMWILLDEVEKAK